MAGIEITFAEKTEARCRISSNYRHRLASNTATEALRFPKARGPALVRSPECVADRHSVADYVVGTEFRVVVHKVVSEFRADEQVPPGIKP